MALTIEKQRRLDELLAKRQGATPQQIVPQQDATDANLIGQLKGRLSTFESLDIQKGQPRTGTALQQLQPDPRFMTPRQRLEEVDRRIAELELKKQGKTRKQIQFALDVNRATERPKIGRPAGGIVGALGATAIAGRVIPGPIDDAMILAALIAGVGAGVGGVTGEAIQTGIEERRILGKREALKAFAIEAGTELTARGVVGTGKLLFGPAIKKTVPEAAALIEDYAKFGGTFSPTELDNRFSLRIAEAFSRGSFGAKEIFQEFEERQGMAAIAYAKSIVDGVGEGVARQTTQEIGELFAKGITKPGGRVFNLIDDLFDPLYNQLDDLTKSSIVKQTAEISVPTTILDEFGKPFQKNVTRVIGERIKGTGVSTRSLKAFRAKTIAQNQRLVDAAKRTGKELPLISGPGKEILKDIDNLPEFVGHSDYRAFRTKILKETRKFNRETDISEGMVKEISAITRKELLEPKSVAGASPQAKRLHANINNLYVATQEALETTFAEGLAKRLLKNPSNIVKEVIKNNSPKSIRLLRKSLVEPISGKPSAAGKMLWNQIRQEWLANAVEQATKEGVVNPRVYNNILRNLGREGFEEMFPETSVRASVDKIQDLFTIVGKRAPAGASLFSRGAQTVGAVKIWQGAKAGDFISMASGGVLTIGPLAFAKLATTPKGVKFLTAGLRLKPGASGLLPFAVRMKRLLIAQRRRELQSRFDIQKEKRMAAKLKRARPKFPTLGEQRGFNGRGF